VKHEVRSLSALLANLEMEDVDYKVCPAIQENHVAANYDVRALWRRGRKAAFQLLGTRLDALLQAWRERPSADELLLEAWRQSVFFRQPGRKIIVVVVIPAAHGHAVVIAIEMFFLPIIVVPVLIVAFSLALA
jgi:hypothetical protein